jgi:hypothetical protein
MTNTSKDWRLTNQEKYLMGETLFWRSYAPSNADNDHDHCEFCSIKFMAAPTPDCLTEGYSSVNGYRWICKECFNDFTGMFGWHVAQ